MKTISLFLKNEITTASNWLWRIFFIPVCQNEGQSESLMHPLIHCLSKQCKSYIHTCNNFLFDAALFNSTFKLCWRSIFIFYCQSIMEKMMWTQMHLHTDNMVRLSLNAWLVQDVRTTAISVWTHTFTTDLSQIFTTRCNWCFKFTKSHKGIYKVEHTNARKELSEFMKLSLCYKSKDY